MVISDIAKGSFLSVVTALAVLAASYAGEPRALGDLSPLSVSSNGRYLQDASGRPFFLVGDCPQNLPLKLAAPEFDRYMDDCAERGFNLLWICIDGQRSNKGNEKPPIDRQDNRMMVNGWDIGTLNPAYFATIAAALGAAQRHGIYCMLTPLSSRGLRSRTPVRNSSSPPAPTSRAVRTGCWFWRSPKNDATSDRARPVLAVPKPHPPPNDHNLSGANTLIPHRV